MKILFDSFGLCDKVIVHVKDGSNLNTLTNALKFVVFCFSFQLPTPLGSCFGHAMSKAISMPLMMPKFVKVFKKLVSRLFKHHCKKLLLGLKN